MSIADKLVEIAENIKKVYEAGKQSGDNYYDFFWDTFQTEGKKVSYLNTFAGNGWTDEIYNPKYPINATVGSSYLFHNNQKITSTKVPITISASGASVFNGCNALKEIPSIKVTASVNFGTWFNGCYSLETINFTEDEDCAIANNIDFSPCPLLTAKSIVSIVEALSDSASEKTATFKQSAIDNAKFPVTSEKTGITYASWDALKATKTNWTFKNESGTVI